MVCYQKKGTHAVLGLTDKCTDALSKPLEIVFFCEKALLFMIKRRFFPLILPAIAIGLAHCTSQPAMNQSSNYQEQLQSLAQQDSNLLINDAKDSQKMVVYQMFTRLFGNLQTKNAPFGTQEENGVGKFSDINEQALQSLKELGATHVWYTGVIEHAVLHDYQQYDIPLDDADVVKGRAGSPYAIKDYYDVNPDLAEDVPNRMREFEALVERTHAQDLKVLIDFVPNHVARFYQSDARPDSVENFGAQDDTQQAFDPNNNFYYIVGEPFRVPPGYNSLGDHAFPTKDGKFAENPAKATGNDQFVADPTVDDWFETIKLNYGVDYMNGRQTHFEPIPDTWHKMHNILRYWADKQVDGFRCDMAEMVPVEFWEWVIPQVKEQHPDLVFVAEIYNPQAYRTYIEQGGFDYLYDKVQLYDTLRSVVEGHGTTDHLTDIWQSLRGINHHMLRFLENHDEQRIASRFFAGDPVRAQPAMVITALWHSSPVMVYFGQEVGEPGGANEGFSGDDGRTTIFDYWGVPEHQKWVNEHRYDGGQLSEAQQNLRQFYQRLLNLAHEDVIARGNFYDLHPYNREHTEGYSDQVYAFLRFTKEQRWLIVTNLDAKQEQQFNLKIPAAAQQAMGLPEGATYVLRDLLSSDTELTWSVSDDAAIPITLAPLQSLVLAIEAE